MAVTGASGFVGRVLCHRLLEDGMEVFAAVRQQSSGRLFSIAQFTEVVVGELGADTDWSTALNDVDVVIHLAARVHVMHDTVADPQAEFKRVNVAGTERLARCAAAAGVKRLVYASSIKVNGEATHGGARFTEADASAPHDPYGVSKLEAEQALRRVEQETGLEVVVVRPPLVYGPGVRGNFLRLMKLVARGVPLPFAGVDNRRDLVYVGNLADAIAACINHPQAAGQTFLVCDGAPLSTPDLIRRLAQALGKSPRLFAVPAFLFDVVGRISGKAALQRLTGSLQIDNSHIRNMLGWRPPFSVDEGLRLTAQWYGAVCHADH